MANFVDVILRLVKGTPLTYGEMDSNFANLQGATAPYGAIAIHPSTEAVAGWLVCDGSTLNSLSYPDLFASIGYTYGGSAGDFLLPDLRGRFVRGWDTAGYADPDRVFGSYQLSQMAYHHHRVMSNQDQPAGTLSYDIGNVQQKFHSGGGIWDCGYTMPEGGGDSPNEDSTHPYNAAMNYIIKVL